MQGNTMKKKILSILSLLTLPLFTLSCSKLSELKWEGMNAKLWLESYPWVNIKFAGLNFILSKPTSTFFIYFLGIITVLTGIYFIRKRDNQKSRTWWGIGLILWGIGGLLAGTSYQAFNYELKCAGRETALWTSWFEVLYLLFQTFSVNALIIAVVNSSIEQAKRKFFYIYAVVNSILYTIILFSGAFIPDQFMVSFEMMVLFTMPGFIALFVINLKNYKKTKDIMEKKLMTVWLLLAVVLAAYFAYMFLGITDKLWNKGIWFSDNDVFHIGLIFWIAYIYKGTARYIKDKSN